MKVALGLVLGLLGGVLLNVVIGSVSVVFTGGSDHSSDSNLVNVLVFAWTALLSAVSATALLFRARSSLAVIRRGSIMGIVLWALMIPFGTMAVARRVLARSGGDSGVVGFASTITMAVSVFMVIVCAACLVGVHFAAKRKEGASRKTALPTTA